MKNLLNPKWLLLVNTLPICIFLFIAYGEYNIIKTLLSAESSRLWVGFGVMLFLLGGINVAYALYSLREKEEEVSPIYLGFAFFVYTAFLYIYAYHIDKIFPSNLPQWMVSDYLPIYMGTFLMPTLAYTVLGLVVYFTPNDREHKARNSFALSLAIPIIWYIFAQGISPLWRIYDDLSIHFIMVLAISSVVCFLFFFVRGIYIIVNRNSEISKETRFILYLTVSLMLPIMGLLVNDHYDSYSIDEGIFGNFSHPLFYIITVLNAVFLCFPTPEKFPLRLGLFVGKMVTFSYTFYFFWVFLPFLPLSIIAILAVGMGFLMLTPLALFVVHTQEITKDFAYLENYIDKNKLWAISFVSFMLIPVGITMFYLHDRNVLTTALEYVYAPDYAKTYSIDKNSLENTLKGVQKNKNRRWRMGASIPYLSSFYNWLVLDNMTLSDTKIRQMRSIFFANPADTIPFPISQEMEAPPEPIINNDTFRLWTTQIQTESHFDSLQNAWKSTIHLEITNKTNNSLQEYSTILDLPTGAWISDYYLYVGDKKEMGILAEKKAAMWVFSQITRTNRDPGILHYLTGNKVAFRVFPFAKDEVRKTGFELIHKEPLRWNIDGQSIQLGNVAEQRTTLDTGFNKNVFYVSGKEKKQLTTITRRPYYHFIVDASSRADGSHTKQAYIKSIEDILAKNNVPAANAVMSFTNTLVKTVPFSANWKNELQQESFDGGFFAERAIKKALFDAYLQRKGAYPIIVLVSNAMDRAVISNDFADWGFTYPESPYFYEADTYGRLYSHSLLEKSGERLQQIDSINTTNKVLAFPNPANPIAYLKKDSLASIVLRNDRFEIDEETLKEKDWSSGLALQGQYLSQILHPETADTKWLSLIRQSFKTKLLSPYTAYMVVENEAQKAMLLRKQQEALSGKKNLDLDEEVERMSEPNIWLLLGLLLLFLGYQRRRVA